MPGRHRESYDFENEKKREKERKERTYCDCDMTRTYLLQVIENCKGSILENINYYINHKNFQ